MMRASRFSSTYVTKYKSKPYKSTVDMGIAASQYPINPTGAYTADSVWLTLDGSNNVTVWNDTTGNGNHLSTVSSTKPVYHSDVTVNGYPSILFGGSAWIGRASTITTPSTYFVVGKINSYSQYTALIGGMTTYTWAINQSQDGSGYVRCYSEGKDGGTNVTSPVGSWALWILVGNGNSSTVRVNNGSPVTENGTTNNSGGLAIGSMGQTGPGSYNINAYIREVCYFNNNAMGSTDIASMKTYFNNLYALW